MAKKSVSFLFLILVAFLVGCGQSGERTRLLASYPAEKPIAVYPALPPDVFVIYQATITLAVKDVDKSLKDAANLVNEFRGYIASSQSWNQEGQKHTTVIFAVPAVHFEGVHQKMLTLGDLVSENVSGELKSPSIESNPRQMYSYITLHLQPTEKIFVSSGLPNWRPIQTFTNAWHIFITIFGFLVDILIWIIVVAGPFVFLGWLAKKVIQRMIKRRSP